MAATPESDSDGLLGLGRRYKGICRSLHESCKHYECSCAESEAAVPADCQSLSHFILRRIINVQSNSCEEFYFLPSGRWFDIAMGEKDLSLISTLTEDTHHVIPFEISSLLSGFRKFRQIIYTIKNRCATSHPKLTFINRKSKFPIYYVTVGFLSQRLCPFVNDYMLSPAAPKFSPADPFVSSAESCRCAIPVPRHGEICGLCVSN
jgi:hypothetical protein